MIVDCVESAIKNMKDDQKFVVIPLDFYNKCQQIKDILKKWHCTGYTYNMKIHDFTEIK